MADEEELKQVVYHLSERLLDEIQVQRILISTEKNELVIYPEMMGVKDLLDTEKICIAIMIQLMVNSWNKDQSHSS